MSNKEIKLKDFLTDVIEEANDDYVNAVGDKKPDAIVNEILKRRSVLIDINNICRNRNKF